AVGHDVAGPSSVGVSIAGLPMLTSQARDWDQPGGEAPERLPAPPMQAGADEEPLAPEPAGEAGAGGLAGGVDAGTRTAISPLRSTSRKLNEVGDGARGLIGGAGERIGSLTQRAGAFVDDVRDEFRPVPQESDSDGRTRFNPAPIVLCVMIGLV